jgi:hypothetical protein
MSKENIWVPSSGCFSCPFGANIDLGNNLAGSTINPFPGFANLKTGWFSPIMSTWYLPIENCQHSSTFDPSTHTHNIDFGEMNGEIEVKNMEKLMVIAQHEFAHQAYKWTTPKVLMQFLATRAWEILCELMYFEEDNPKLWIQLASLNNSIEQIAKSIHLVEELFATFLGIHESQQHISPTSLKEIREGSLKTQGERHSSKFCELYEKLEKICDVTGIGVFNTLSVITQCPIDIIMNEDNIWTPQSSRKYTARMEDFTEERAMLRLEKALDLLSLSHLTKEEMQNTNWHEFFSRWMPEYRHNFQSIIKTITFLSYQIDRSAEEWGKRFLSPWHNPIEGMKLIDNHDRETGKMLMVICHPETLKDIWLRRIEEDKVADNTFKEFVKKTLMSKFDDLLAHNRVLVQILPAQGQRTMIFLPERRDTGEILPDGLPLLDSVMLDSEEMIRHTAIVRTNLTALKLYEGLRQQIGKGCGIHCPLHIQDGSDYCCGSREKLMRLWKAGKKAAERSGIPFEKWEEPTCTEGYQKEPRIQTVSWRKV